MLYNIVLICDDKYAMPTAVTIQSIKNHLDAVNSYNVFVCSFELSSENIYRLEQLSCKQLKVVVKILNKDVFSANLSSVLQRSHVTPSALIKFELPNIFNDLQKILYLDSDIIVKESICKIFKIDVSNYYLAASFELWKHLDQLYYSLNWNKHTEFYFNSGVMLLNLELMRKDNVSDKLWDYKINRSKTTLMDQESLNEVCGKKSLTLGIKWNFNPIFLDEKYLKIINKVYSTNYCNISDLLEDIRIIHYVGKTDKPWRYKTANMGDSWLANFKELNWQNCLDQQSVNDNGPSIPFWRVIINGHGVQGLLCFIINKILGRV